MVSYKKFFFTLGCLALAFDRVVAGTATVVVITDVRSIDAISLSGNPNALEISSTTPGTGIVSVTDSSTTYSVTTNSTDRKISAVLQTGLIEGVTLSITLTAPNGATSLGKVDLSSTASHDLVTGISYVAESGLQITYTLTADLRAAKADARMSTIMYTIGP